MSHHLKGLVPLLFLAVICCLFSYLWYHGDSSKQDRDPGLQETGL